MQGERVRVGVLVALLGLGAALPHAGAAGAVPPKLSAHDVRVNALLARMTLDEKIGQMTQPDQEFLKDEADIETYFLGSVLSGGDSDPKTNSLADWTEMYERLQAHSRQDAAEDPAALRRRRGARPQQRAGGGDLPAQHRPRGHARRGAGRGDRAHHRPRRSAPPASSGPSRRASPCRGTSAGAAPTKASARIRSWWPSSARPPSAACRAHGLDDPLRRARLRQALRRRRRHDLSARGAATARRALPPRPGRHAPGRGRPGRDPHAGLRDRDRRRASGTIMPSYNPGTARRPREASACSPRS